MTKPSAVAGEAPSVCVTLTIAAAAFAVSTPASASSSSSSSSAATACASTSSSTSASVSTQLSLRLLDTSAAVTGWFSALSAQLEALHLPLECEKDETWGSRLAIAKKGGGWHYAAEEQALADGAYARIAPLYDYVTASSQLAEKAELLPRLVETLSVQKQLSKQQKLERCIAAQRATLDLLERLGGDATLGPFRRRLAQARLPDTLPTSLLLTWRALPALLRDVLALADEEHRYWGMEPPAKRKFRTPRTHAILHAALQLAAEQEGHAALAHMLDEGAGAGRGEADVLSEEDDDLAGGGGGGDGFHDGPHDDGGRRDPAVTMAPIRPSLWTATRRDHRHCRSRRRSRRRCRRRRHHHRRRRHHHPHRRHPPSPP